MQVLFLILTLCAFGNAFLYDFLFQLSKYTQWIAFKTKYVKNYSTSQENSCLNHFWKNAMEVRAHNKLFAKGLVSYKMDLNQFCDRDPVEFIRHNTGLIVGKVEANVKAKEKEDVQSSVVTIPAEYNACTAIPNWTVRDQADCGTCWSFSTLGSIEGAYYKKNSVLLDLSEQHLTDCVYSRNGCNGGWMPTAFNYIKDVSKGNLYEQDYPYTAKYIYTAEKCQAVNKTRLAKLGTTVSYYTVASDDDSIKRKLMEIGPLSVAVDASDWFLYKSGVYKNETRTFSPNHAVLICGWGTFNNAPYWVIRNSWGSNWGLGGYIWVNAERSIKDAKVTKGGLYTQYIFYPSLA